MTIDEEVYKEAQRRNINISDAAELGIRQRLNMEEIKEDMEKRAKKYSKKAQELLEIIEPEDLAKCKEAVSRDPEFSRGWQRILKDKYGVELSRTEIIKVFGKH